jgi:uncharacterized protein YbbC (DUF1343 family)
LRHGLTMGELALLENGELGLGADLHVVQMTGWTRDQWFDATGQPWVNPSPNIRNLNAAILYPALALLESSTNYSVGRGTDAPFEQVGAAWIDGPALAKYMTSRDIPGVRFHPVEFTPTSSNLSGKKLQGIGFELTNRDLFSAARLGLELAQALRTLYPGKIDWAVNRRLIGSQAITGALARGDAVLPPAESGVTEFLAMRGKYLIYR